MKQRQNSKPAVVRGTMLDFLKDQGYTHVGEYGNGKGGTPPPGALIIGKSMAERIVEYIPREKGRRHGRTPRTV